MENESRLAASVALAKDLGGMAVTVVGLFAYALWADAEVYWLRVTFRGRKADVLAARQAREFRQLLGVPEPGEGWD